MHGFFTYILPSIYATFRSIFHKKDHLGKFSSSLSTSKKSGFVGFMISDVPTALWGFRAHPKLFPQKQVRLNDLFEGHFSSKQCNVWRSIHSGQIIPTSHEFWAPKTHGLVREIPLFQGNPPHFGSSCFQFPKSQEASRSLTEQWEPCCGFESDTESYEDVVAGESSDEGNPSFAVKQIPRVANTTLSFDRPMLVTKVTKVISTTPRPRLVVKPVKDDSLALTAVSPKVQEQSLVGNVSVREVRWKACHGGVPPLPTVFLKLGIRLH